MSDSESNEGVHDLASGLIKIELDRMDKQTAKDGLLTLAEACIVALSTSDVEKKYHLVEALTKVLGDPMFRLIAQNQKDLYGEPWEQWTQ